MEELFCGTALGGLYDGAGEGCRASLAARATLVMCAVRFASLCETVPRRATTGDIDPFRGGGGDLLFVTREPKALLTALTEALNGPRARIGDLEVFRAFSCIAIR